MSRYGLFLHCLLSFVLLVTVTITSAQTKENSELTYTEKLSKRFPDSAFLLLKYMYNRSLEKKDRLATGNCLQQMGQISFYLSNYVKALDFHMQADKIFREKNAKENIAANLNDMGILYYYNKQAPLARKQYEEALSIYSRINNKAGVADTYGRIGHLYEKQGRYDSAFFFQRRALNEYKGISAKAGQAKIFENMGSIFEDLAKYDSALYYFNQSLVSYREAGQEIETIEVLNNLGDIARKTEKYTEALQLTRSALALATRKNDRYQEGAAYRDLGKTWNLLHHDDSAYHYLELSRRATIDIYSQDNNRQTAFLRVLFDIDKKNEEITRLENDRSITIIITIAVLIVISLLVVLGWVTISRQRFKIKNERLLSEQLKQELDIKEKGLASYTLHIIQKNQLLEDFGSRLEAMVKDEKRDHKKQLQQLIQQIQTSFNHDRYWEEFRESFEQVHQQFFENLKKHCDDLTANDLRLIALIKLNLATKDIATLQRISPESLRVAKYRLRKKLGLAAGASLTAFIQSL